MIFSNRSTKVRNKLEFFVDWDIKSGIHRSSSLGRNELKCAVARGTLVSDSQMYFSK